MPCYSLQDFARKFFVRYGAGHADGADHRAIGYDRAGSRGVLTHLVLVTNQTGEQLNVVSNFPGGDSSSVFVAACEISCQSADGTTHTWIIAMGFAQVIINQRVVGDARPASGGGIDPLFPHFQRRADRFSNQRVTRFEVLIEATHGEAGFLHQVRDSNPREPLFAKFLRRDRHDALMCFCLFGSGMAHCRPLRKSITKSPSHVSNAWYGL